MGAIDPEVQMILSEVKATRFYGSVELKYENGVLVLIKQSQTIKPTSNRSTRSDGKVGS